MTEQGSVVLVGGGPGDPGLLTLAGRAAINGADVILYDRLLGPEIIAMLPEGALRLDVGKTKGNHPVPQEEINRLILEHARAGKRVVRLKGGDPYLFGRGAEELAAVAAAGIPFRVVPGVTSAIAVPAWAGIPVTHRGSASSVHIMTGHGSDGESGALPFEHLARLGGTLVFLMSVTAVGRICSGLMAAGMAPGTPAAMVENGTRSDQRRRTATLASMAEVAGREQARSPAVLVVGGVVSLAETLDWTARQPLHGKRILVVSARSTGSRLAARLRAEGAAADEFAGITTQPNPLPGEFWAGLDRYSWVVLTSPYGAEQFMEALFAAGHDARFLAGRKVAAVGGRTAEVLLRRGIRPDFVPDTFTGEALGKGLVPRIRPDEAVLLYRAADGGEDLPEALRGNSIACTDFAAYRTERNRPAAEIQARIEAGSYDAVTLTSASAAEAFADAAGTGANRMPAFCIGPATAEAAERRGMRTLASRAASIDSMVALILERMGT